MHSANHQGTKTTTANNAAPFFRTVYKYHWPRAGPFALNDTLTAFKHINIKSGISFHFTLIILLCPDLYKVEHVGELFIDLVVREYNKRGEPHNRPRRTHRVSGGIAQLFLNLCTRGGCVFSITPRPPLPPGKTRYALYRRLGGPRSRSG